MENSMNAQVKLAKSDYSRQEGTHSSVAHNSAKSVTTSGLIGVIKVKIPSEDIDFHLHRSWGGQSIITP